MSWRTAISSVAPNQVRLRGYRVEDLMGRLTFGEGIYLLLKGQLATPAQGQMMEAILVACLDHGVLAPSTAAARFVASAGVPLPSAVAAGVLAIGEHHGGAIEPLARLLVSGKTASEIVAHERRVPGFGHPLHTDDPRAWRLLRLAHELELAGRQVGLVEELAALLKGKAPLNVDGAIAGIVLDLGFPPELGMAFFLMGRVPGLVGHVHEEMTEERPFRRVAPETVEYAGPAPRELPPDRR